MCVCSVGTGIFTAGGERGLGSQTFIETDGFLLKERGSAAEEEEVKARRREGAREEIKRKERTHKKRETGEMK